MTGSAGHDCPSLRFRDLKAQWYHEAIDEALNKGLVNGMTEDLFQPEGTLTRAQFVTILHRLAGCPDSSQDTPFTDLRSGSFYEEAVRWAYEKGYINGTSQSTFSPNAPLTREMAAAILWRMAGSPASSQALDASPTPRRSTPTLKRPWPGLWSRPLWLAPPPPPWLPCPPPPGPKAWSW